MHPYHHVNADKRERDHSMVKRTGNHFAKGGAITKEWDEKQDEHDIARGVHAHEKHLHKGQPKTKLKAGGTVEGEHAHHHMGKRARGGHTGKGKHVTNVIVQPQGGGGMHPAMPMGQPMGQPMAAPRPPPPRPAAPPMPSGGGAPMGGAPMGGPPMGVRPPGAMKRGGKVKHRAEGGSADECSEERPERKHGGGVQKMQEVGVPSESLMQSNRGGHVRKRDLGGSAGVPANPTQMSPQQLQRIAQIRQAQRMAAQQGMNGGPRPGGMQGPMGAAQAARMSNPPMQKDGGKVHVKEHHRRARGGHVPDMEAGAGGGEGRIEKTHEYGEGGFKPKKVPLHA